MKRICECGCGRVLHNHRPQARYYEDACRKKRHQKTRVLQRPFIALDGEGQTIQGEHRYTLLAAHHKGYIESKQGLDTEACLDFLLQLPRGSQQGIKPIYVWFAFDYDVNMMLKDVPLKGENSIEELKQTNTIYWRGYRITYIRRKIFRIARGNRRHTSYDIWGFFQGSFEKALGDWGLQPGSIITEGKSSRASFNRWAMHRIREYNEEELRLLSILAEKLRDAVRPLELPIQSWHGPAALAGAWLQKNHVKGWLNETPQSLSDAASRAYFGGRIDVRGYGIVDPVYHYDIVSAYPSAIRNLPNLKKINWIAARELPPRGKIFVARIKWNIPTTNWGVFPWRSKHGSIFWPLEGEGWYWNSEVYSALDKFGKEHFEIQEVWLAEGKYEFPFRGLIEEAFQYRAELKAQNHPSHVAVKLVLNSLYGKFAQTVGSARYHSSIWAGMITAEARAQLATAITDDVVCVMTDSIWSTKPLNLTLGEGLGEWESQDESVLYLAEAGLYEAEKPDGTTHVWQRGFDKRNPVDIRGLVQEWLRGDPTYKPTYEVLRFIGMGLATVTHQPWRQWVTMQRSIEPVPMAGTTKRLPLYPVDMSTYLSDSFIDLQPRPRNEQVCSYAYEKLTLDPLLIEERLQDECEE